MEQDINIRYFRFQSLLQRSGWMSPAYAGIDDRGALRSLSKVAPPDAATEAVLGMALPGFQNAHSHAFQYSMIGRAEIHPRGTTDDFWTWREVMYQRAMAVDPDQAEAIAAMLYAEMLRSGYTQVAEFHYLHHDKDGRPYTNLAEMGERMIAAAQTAGIKITLIPVFYQKGGFGMDPQPRQKRFLSTTTEAYLKLLGATEQSIRKYKDATMGFSVHSLRAVELPLVRETFTQGPAKLPFHLHVAEQRKEVDDCLAHCGKRPMQWLLENLPVDQRFNFVHATHLDDSELSSLAASQANVILCPSTEGNLGDGIFRMKEYCVNGGRWTIGTDSHIGLDPLEEFRMIDYRQRLLTNKRNTFEGDGAAYMINESVERGRMAMGTAHHEHFEIGAPFDAVVYDAQAPGLLSAGTEGSLPALVYHHGRSSVLGTIVNGKWVVKDQEHIRMKPIRDAFTKAMKDITSQVLVQTA